MDSWTRKGMLRCLVNGSSDDCQESECRLILLPRLLVKTAYIDFVLFIGLGTRVLRSSTSPDGQKLSILHSIP